MAVVRASASLMRWPTARIYIRGAGLGHAGLGLVWPIPFSSWGLTRVHRTRAAIINSLGATQLRLVAPSALVPSLLPAGRGLLPCLPAYIALPNRPSRVEWSGVWGPGATFSRRSLAAVSIVTTNAPSQLGIGSKLQVDSK